MDVPIVTVVLLYVCLYMCVVIRWRSGDDSREFRPESGQAVESCSQDHHFQ